MSITVSVTASVTVILTKPQQNREKLQVLFSAGSVTVIVTIWPKFGLIHPPLVGKGYNYSYTCCYEYWKLIFIDNKIVTVTLAAMNTASSSSMLTK